eukprot:COSAG06_NODE_48216_length_333_cov_1.888889_1_plen_82_part_10
MVRTLCGRPRRPRSILLDFGGSLVFPLNKYLGVGALAQAAPGARGRAKENGRALDPECVQNWPVFRLSQCCALSQPNEGDVR